MQLAMPIFKFSRALPIKNHVWKFGVDWLSLSRVIVLKKKKKKTHTQLKTISFLQADKKKPIGGGVGYIWPVMPVFELRWAIPVKSDVWKFGLDWLKLEVC